MVKEFQTITGVARFINNFAESMEIIHDSYLLGHDLTFDADMSKDWAKEHAYEYMPFVIYLRAHGTFTNFGSQNLVADKEYWSKESIGQLKVTRNLNRKFTVEYINNWD